MRAGLVGLLVVIAIAVVVALNAFFIVNPMQQALVLQFGQVRQAVRDPGLNFKIPVIQDVLYLDKRVLDLNLPAQEIIASDQKRLVVDAFARYRIANPVRFYQTVNNVREGATRLSTFAQSSLRAVLADATFQDIVRDDRADLMLRIRSDVAARARDIGIDVVDVRIRRADLPETNSQAIFDRMETERNQEATQIRAQGNEAAQRIRAAADRTATVLRAEAQREAEQIRGEGDGQKNAIFARAYSQDPQFFTFFRAMQAYENALASNDTRLVLSPDADFFRYFNDPSGGAGGGLSGLVDSILPTPAPQVAAPADDDAAPADQTASTGPTGDAQSSPAVDAAEAALQEAVEQAKEADVNPASTLIENYIEPAGEGEASTAATPSTDEATATPAAPADTGTSASTEATTPEAGSAATAPESGTDASETPAGSAATGSDDASATPSTGAEETSPASEGTSAPADTGSQSGGTSQSGG